MARHALASVEKVPADRQAASRLREAIVDGLLLPGTRITEARLSTDLGLSRATVRAALQQLQNEGLTRLKPYSGWLVVPLGVDDVREIYTLRASLERLAGRIVAEAPSAGRETALGKAMAVLEQACAKGNALKVAEADFGLHRTIVSLTGHNRLTALYETLAPQIRLYMRAIHRVFPEPGMIVDQHRAIVDAILGGDVDRAGGLSEAHNVTDGAELAAILAASQPRRATA